MLRDEAAELPEVHHAVAVEIEVCHERLQFLLLQRDAQLPQPVLHLCAAQMAISADVEAGEQLLMAQPLLIQLLEDLVQHAVHLRPREVVPDLPLPRRPRFLCGPCLRGDVRGLLPDAVEDAVGGSASDLRGSAARSKSTALQLVVAGPAQLRLGPRAAHRPLRRSARRGSLLAHALLGAPPLGGVVGAGAAIRPPRLDLLVQLVRAPPPAAWSAADVQQLVPAGPSAVADDRQRVPATPRGGGGRRHVPAGPPMDRHPAGGRVHEALELERPRSRHRQAVLRRLPRRLVGGAPPALQHGGASRPQHAGVCHALGAPQVDARRAPDAGDL
mmetsp:Transcript_40660/g.116453  ORF Transcript_40660/g.116453 Transcript_40660/m.116453 type:complete len:330 (+) Transcript_40660:419-1408(+)